MSTVVRDESRRTERRGIGCVVVLLVALVLVCGGYYAIWDELYVTSYTLVYRDFEIEIDEELQLKSLTITRPELLDDSPFEIRVSADAKSYPVYELPENVVAEYVNQMGGDVHNRTRMGDETETQVTSYSGNSPNSLYLVYWDGALQRGHFERPIVKFPSEVAFSELPTGKREIVERIGKPDKVTTDHFFKHPFRISAH